MSNFSGTIPFACENDSTLITKKRGVKNMISDENMKKIQSKYFKIEFHKHY